MVTDEKRAAYVQKLRDPRWQKKRLEVMERDEFTCQNCFDSQSTLNVHHLIYSKGDPWEVDASLLLTLCESCHEAETEGRRNSEWRLTRALRALGCLSDDFDRLAYGFEQLLENNSGMSIRTYEACALGWLVSERNRVAGVFEVYMDSIRERATERNVSPIGLAIDDAEECKK